MKWKNAAIYAAETERTILFDKLPAYVRVYNALRSRILDGDYAIGDLLPPEPELEKLFQVSRTTVRRATEMLSREGMVEARQGKGTVVLDYTITQSINEVTSISETLERNGRAVRTGSMQIDRIAASARLAGEMHVPEGTPLVRIQRLQLADETPIAIMRNYLLPETAPGIEKCSGLFSHLYDFLEQHYGLQIDAANDKISARSATEEDALLLHVPRGEALIYLNRTCYSNGRIVMLDHCRILGSKYELEVHMDNRRR